MKRHPHSGVVVYNACGAALSIAQGFPDVQTILQGDGSTRILRDAMEKHGGIEEMYGTEVARLADWVAINAKPKRDKPHLPARARPRRRGACGRGVVPGAARLASWPRSPGV